MPDTITCFACEREPVQQCSRCGRPYCDEHGEELCDVCMQPSSGVPSFTLYRGSLLALLVGVAVAVWLLVQPTSGDNGALAKPIILTPTRAAAQTSVTAAPQTSTTPGTTPAASTTAGAQTTPGTPGVTATKPAVTGTVVVTGTASATSSDYTVVSGDTLSSICAKQRPAMSSTDCVAQLRSLNAISGDSISIGQKLKLP